MPAPRRRGVPLARLALSAMLVCATRGAAAQDRPPPASWAGVWLLHEPSHGSYAGTVYRLDPSGAVTITAMLDTNEHRGRRPRQVGSVWRGRVACRFGDRWRPGATPDRLVFAGTCSDGRPRDIELTVTMQGPTPLSAWYVPRILRVGGQRGWVRGNYWEWEFLRCDTDPNGRCEDFERRRDVYHPPAP